MERLVQYLDDIEDLYCAALVVMERIRNVMQLCLLLVASFAVPFLGILLALSRPPLALAAVSLAVVAILYRAATHSYPAQPDLDPWPGPARSP